MPLAVHRHRDGAAQGRVADRGAAESEHDRADETAEQELVVDEASEDRVRV
jgi:hypothetical protein